MNTTQQPLAWSEQLIAEKITAFKDDEDYAGLESFLRKRIEEDDPCCISLQPRFYNELGLINVAGEKLDDAGDCFNRAIAIAPDNINVLYNLATLKMQAGALDEALNRFKQVMQRDPDHFSSLYNCALCLLYQEKQQAALPFLERAAVIRPDHGHTRYLAGEILMQLNRPGEALPHFKAAYQEHSDHFETTMGLAAAMLQTGSYDSAAALCNEALMTFGAATLPLQIKADAMIELKEFGEAVMCHMDLCNLDLDIRDFVVSRLTSMAKETPEDFSAYAEVVDEFFPEFESIISQVQSIFEQSSDEA